MGGEAETMFNQVTFILFFYQYIITRTFKQHKKHYHQVQYIESTWEGHKNKFLIKTLTKK